MATPRRFLPSGDNFTPEQIELIKVYRTDKVRGARELLHVVDRDVEGKVVSLEYNALQRDLHATLTKIRALRLREGIGGQLKIICLKARRQGQSAKFLADGFLDCGFGRYYRAAVVAHKEDTALKLNKMARVFHDEWPSDKEDPRRGLLSAMGVTLSNDEINFHGNGSVMSFGSAGGRDIRGGGQNLIVGSEFAHYSNYKSWNSLVDEAATDATIVIDSTAAGPAGAFHQSYWDALPFEEVEKAYAIGDWDTITRWGGMFRYFFPWWRDPGYTMPVRSAESSVIMSTLDPYEQMMVDRFHLTPGQIKWRRWKLNEKRSHPTLTAQSAFAQEFPAFEEEAFQGSGTQPFDGQELQLQTLAAATRRPKAVLRIERDTVQQAILGGSNLVVFDGPREGADYVIGADAGNGLENGDWSVGAVYDRCDGTMLRQTAEFRARGQHGQAAWFGEILVLLAELYNGAFLMPEVSPPGNTTCEVIVKNRYMRIHKRTPMNRVGEVNFDNGFLYGFLTGASGKSAAKHVLIEDLREAIVRRWIEILSLRTLTEMKAYQRVDGEYRAPAGDYDDCVMATALACRGQKSAGPLRRPTRLKRALGTTATHQAFERAVQRKILDSQRRNAEELSGHKRTPLDWELRRRGEVEIVAEVEALDEVKLSE